VADVLYYFNGVVWMKDDKKYSNLIKFFDKVFYADLMKYANSEMEKFTALLATDEENAKNTIEKISSFIGCITTLRKNHIRKSVIEDIIMFNTNNDIKFNTNPYLFAFNNCVFDLKQMKFVNSDPRFYITQTTGYDYIPSTKIERAELMTIIDSIFPKVDIKR
jgi:phage/plasmid-associated DNA primase